MGDGRRGADPARPSQRDPRHRAPLGRAGLRRDQHGAGGGPRRLGERRADRRRPRRGVGGHADFCRAACRCPGGLSVIVLRSSHRGRSTIVEKVTTVSTPRTDVDVVVTEHGVADLRGRSDRERAEALVAVARPDHRADLAAAAAQRG
ncbi:MAG: hypothetical protein M5U14_17160 [Acidimicrobiia bacterium]|nr:hypothetical protein [Acidimicrobiia bacterium]